MSLRPPGPSTPDNVITYEEIALSKPFRFSIGPGKREFTIHSALVAKQSPAFDRLVNGGFKEAQDGHAELESVDEDTFVRFVQYAYTGRYGDPEEYPDPDDDVRASPEREAKELPDLVRDEEAVPDEATPAAAAGPEPDPEPASVPAEPTAEDDWWGAWGSVKSKKKIGVFRALRKQFRSKVSALGPEPIEEPVSPLRGDLTRNTYLSHAKMFAFADFWGVTDLAGFSLIKLAKALEDADLKEKRLEWVVELVGYCYDDSDVRPEKLVDLVTLYVGHKLPVLWKNESFRDLFERNKELATALVEAMIEAES